MSILNKKEIGAKVTKLANREKVTKVLLAELSRDAIEYVYESDDIAMINRLLGVLTPVNKKIACLFFSTFMGWTYDSEAVLFTKKQRDIPYAKKLHLAKEFLDSESNNIWTWEDANVAPPSIKPKDYAVKISTLVNKALTDSEQGIDLKEVLNAIMSSDAVSLADMMQEIASMELVEVAA